jgi:hypothetical protein
MTVTILKNYISAEHAKEYIELLDGHSEKTDRGIWNALGYESSLQASTVNGTTGAKLGDLSLVNLRLGDLFDRIKKEAEEIFGEEMDLCQGSYQMMPAGTQNPMHADRVKLDGSPIQPDGAEEELEWSGLLYLNNHEEDFTGGEVEYPNFDIWYKPRAGDVVIFKGDLEHMHEVKEVLSGERKNVVFFWAKRGNVSDGRGYFEY